MKKLFYKYLRAEIFLFLLCIPLFTCLYGCKSKEKARKSTKTDDKLYEEALNYIKNNKLQAAKASLSKIQDDFPFSSYAKNANVLLVYISYKLKNIEEVPSLVDFYFNLYPFDQNIPYLFYINSKVLYKQSTNLKRDLDTFTSLKNMSERLVTNYPQNPYINNSFKLLKYANRGIMLSNLNTAIFYHKEGNCIAATKQYLYVKNNFERYIKPDEMSFIDENIANCLKFFGMQ